MATRLSRGRPDEQHPRVYQRRGQDGWPLHVSSTPSMPLGERAGLADIDPCGDIYLVQIELKHGIGGNGLDHSTNTASTYNLPHVSNYRRVGGTLVSLGTDAQLVVVRTGQGVNRATSIAT